MTQPTRIFWKEIFLCLLFSITFRLGESKPLPPPSASFTLSPSGACPGSPVAFNSTSGGTVGGTLYYWDCNGDGLVDDSSGANIFFSYPSGGTYSATLIVVNPGGFSDTAIVTYIQASCINGIINTYTPVIAMGSCNAVDVLSSAGFNPGDKVLIIQMKGATIDLSNTAAFGNVTAYNDAGNYEFATIQSITGNTIIFQNQLIRSYDPANGNVQLITVPQYGNAIVTGTLTASPWNGSTGGVLTFEVADSLILNAGMSVNGLGFRGGNTSPNYYGGCSTMGYFFASPALEAADKGEGISEPGVAFGAGMGKKANGGGGGNHVNAGGAGGGNGGQGGRGGDQWGGCPIIPIGGDPGAALNWSTAANKIFLGGGGGGGHQNNSCSTPGVEGGGLILFRANTLVGNGMLIQARGNSQTNMGCIDGGGGGGAGGGIVLEVQNYSGPLSLDAGGGNGGPLNVLNHGPGGGGGGGAIFFSGAALPGNVSALVNNGLYGPASGTSHNATNGSPGVLVSGLIIPESNSPFTLPVVNLGNDTSLCSGPSLQLDAGNPGASYLWSNGAATQQISVNVSGTYWVRVWNNPNCPSTDTIALSFLSAPSVNLGPDDDLCPGDSINLNAGNPGSNFLWWDGTFQQQHIIHSAGTYWVRVTNASLCSDSDTITISPAFNPLVNLGPDTALCQGQSISLNAGNPGNSFFWSTGSIFQQINASSTGTFWVRVTNAQGCIGTDTLQLTINPLPTVNLGPDISFCPNDSLTLNAGNPGSTYLWSNGSSTQQIIAHTAGTYWVRVTSAASCVRADTLNLAHYTLPSLNLGPDTALCQGQSFMLNAGNPGNNYLWSNGSLTQQISTNIAGNYWVRLTTPQGCSVSDTLQFSLNPVPSVFLGPDSGFCPGDSILMDAGNTGSIFLWSDGTGQQQNWISNSGTHWVRVTNSFNCAGSDTVILNAFSVPGNLLGPDTAICQGQSLLLDAGNPGSTWLWSTGSNQQQITVSTAGTFWIQLTTPQGCIIRDTIQVGVNSLPLVSLGPDTAICAGNSFTFDAGNSGSTFLWSNASQSQQFNTGTTGTYWVRVTDANGCQGTDTVFLNVHPLPNVNLGNDTLLCTGDSITLQGGNPPDLFLWSDGSTHPTYTSGTSGMVSLTVTDLNGCSASDQIMITVAPLPLLDLGPDKGICEGNSLILDAGNPGCQYQWSNAAQQGQITITAGGWYSVRVTDPNGCSEEDSVFITQWTNPVVNLGPDSLLCLGTTIQLNAGNPGCQYLWSEGSSQSTLSISAGGLYSVIVTDPNGCRGYDTIDFRESSLSPFSLGPDTTLCGSGQELNLYIQTPGISYLWSNGETGNSIRITQSGKYWLRIVQECGTVSDTILVNIIPFHKGPFPPNAFTPNGDGLNDLFRIESDAIEEDFLLQIFDRWGKLIFQSENQEEYWNGSLNASPLPEGVYIYTYRFRNCDGQHKTIGGSVTLMR